MPARVRWCEETLVPGYRLAVIQSFRQSQKAVAGIAPDGGAPSHHTLHRRFQGFAAALDPVPDYTHSAWGTPGTRLPRASAGAFRSPRRFW